VAETALRSIGGDPHKLASYECRQLAHDFTYRSIHVLDRADLEALSEAAASRNRWEFMLTVNPLALPNATGAPVNPIAMF
jgi:hypothetical protein